ncbi:MAG: type 2a secretion system minor pilin protein GspJ [Idiomarinaceae bacterium HL-53]|nr:MAG: type 2a secretion system minor pilin protein GspJ [Idiomarinaceae bacterium HL-53]CUS47254.1 general secretion pathway protein J [Idiomarinaceae bacterium HL-53]
MRHVRGFTLIEVVIAIAVLALIGLASSAVLLQMTQSDEISRERRKVMTELQFTMLLLDRDIRQMVARSNRQVPEEQRDILLTNDSELLDSEMGAIGFVRGGWQNPLSLLPRSELQPVVYRVRDNTLQRVHTVFVNDTSGDATVQNLLTQVNDFRVTMVQDDEEIARWRVANQLPMQVKVEIEHELLGRIERVLLTSGLRPVGEQP